MEKQTGLSQQKLCYEADHISLETGYDHIMTFTVKVLLYLVVSKFTKIS